MSEGRLPKQLLAVVWVLPNHAGVSVLPWQKYVSGLLQQYGVGSDAAFEDAIKCKSHVKQQILLKPCWLPAQEALAAGSGVGLAECARFLTCVRALTNSTDLHGSPQFLRGQLPIRSIPKVVPTRYRDTNSQTVRLLKGCARALTAIFKRASKLQQQQPHVKQEPAHHGQQQPDLRQQIDSQVVVPTCSSTPQVLPLSGSPDTVVSAEGFRRFAWGGEQAEAPASVHHPTRKSVHDHHQARESNAAPAPLLHEGQNGFRPKRSCADHQFVLYQTLTSRRQAKQHSYVLFVDTYKAFPTVWLDGLFHKLWEKGVRGKMLHVLYNLYQGAQRVASHDGAVTGAFTSNVGLHEGDVISPTLYLFFIDDLLREVWTKHP
eukprot:gene15269-biopygen2950